MRGSIYRAPAALGLLLCPFLASAQEAAPAADTGNTAGFVGPMGAVAIGLIAGVGCFFATQFLKRKLEIDDSLDVSPVHGVGGVIGSLLTGVFAAAWLGGSGFSLDHGVAAQLGVQALGIAAAVAWCGGATWLILKLLDAVSGLRVAEEHETEGLDLAEHGERGYSP